MGRILKISLNPKILLSGIVLQLFFSTAVIAGKEDSNDLNLFGELGLEYSDNIFRLTDDQLSAMNENDPGDIISGRYNGMDSPSDYIIEPHLGIRWDSESPFGGDLRITSWLGYNLYLKNHDSDFPEGRIIFKNSAGEKGVLTLEGKFIYGFRKKNYLSSVDDINNNGNISRLERTYSAAIYDDYEGILEYRYEFVKDKDKKLSELKIKPFAGYSIRSYNPAFENRDRHTALAGVEVQFEFGNRIDLGLTCKYENISSPGNMELVLYDETIAGMDVNGDGVIRRNAPLYTKVDRSSDRYRFAFDPSIKLTKDITFFLGYSKRITEYTSDNPLDIEHYNQKAYKETYRSGISYDLSKSWSAKAEYCRIEDNDPDDGVYKENNYLVLIKYKF